jgi:uncharacterized protein YbjQ (UPF0145 family)
MGLFDMFKKPDPESQAAQAEAAHRQADILFSLRAGRVPTSTLQRLQEARAGKLPWIATLTPAELMVARSHGLRPISAVSATSWLHYGWSWTEGHAQGWGMALQRLKEEARAAGANCVLDVKMRTIPLGIDDSMDFTLVGTAAYVEGLPASPDPIVATVPALEFVKLLEADVVPTGIAVGAHYQWMADWRGGVSNVWMGNTESYDLSRLWETVRQRAHADLRAHAKTQGNGVLAHLNFSQMFEREGGENQPKQYLARHIVIATTVDARRGQVFPHEIKMVVDVHQGRSPLNTTSRHHQSYATNEKEGGI